jgi:hypothetical protein
MLKSITTPINKTIEEQRNVKFVKIVECAILNDLIRRNFHKLAIYMKMDVF